MVDVAPFFFNRASLRALAGEAGERFRSADPFPHAVLDSFLPDDVVRRIAAEFPTPESIEWKQRDWYFERKLSTEDEERFPPYTRQVMYAFNSSIFVEFLEQLSGIPGLIPDPHFRGGGLHQIRTGGKLGVHADFNHYERLNLQRRLNVLLYLNPEWDSEFGGNLELWDRSMTRCELRISPVLNRCVVFSTTDRSYHGHPEPLACPENVTRKSLAFYYYTVERPESEVSAPHTTLFQLRPGESGPPGFADRKRLRKVAEELLPQPILRTIRRLRASISSVAK